MQSRRAPTVPKALPIAVALGASALVGFSTAGPEDASAQSQLSPTTVSVVADMDAVESAMVARINAVRRRHRLAPVRLSPKLAAAAHSHASSMARFGYFAHASRDGTTAAMRIKAFYPSSGFSSWSIGENLLWASPDITPERAIAMWLASPAHRRILMSARWRELGLQRIHVAAAPGVFNGGETTVVVADFGVRVSA